MPDPTASSSAAPRGPSAANGIEALLQRIESDFTYHPPKPGQGDLYVIIREAAKTLATAIVEYVPPGREQSSALTRLEECVMHANAGIARHG